MSTFQFSSEVISVRELHERLLQEVHNDGITVSLEKEKLAEEDERPFVQEVLMVLTTGAIIDAVLKGTITVLIKDAYDKLKAIVNSEPHILIRFEHGGKRKIMYDKSPSEIAEELIAIVTKDKVTIEFRS